MDITEKGTYTFPVEQSGRYLLTFEVESNLANCRILYKKGNGCSLINKNSLIFQKDKYGFSFYCQEQSTIIMNVYGNNEVNITEIYLTREEDV